MIPVPDRMRHLDRDARGYPVPWVVVRDSTGKPHFTVNDEAKRMLCFRDDLCGICGKRLTRGRWFVGGPLSAFDPHGFYVDPPMHAECARFALQVCPYLSSDNWGRSIAGKSVSQEERDRMNIQIVDYTMLPERPSIFVAVMATKQHLHYADGLQTYIVPHRPYRHIEYWRHGKRVDPDRGFVEVREAVIEYARKHGREISPLIQP